MFSPILLLLSILLTPFILPFGKPVGFTTPRRAGSEHRPIRPFAWLVHVPYMEFEARDWLKKKMGSITAVTFGPVLYRVRTNTNESHEAVHVLQLGYFGPLVPIVYGLDLLIFAPFRKETSYRWTRASSVETAAYDLQRDKTQ